MAEDEDDLYAMALGENYHPDSKTSKQSSISKTECSKLNPTSTDKSSDISPDHILRFRELLINSRNQIEKLKNENEQLKTNLKNSIASGGVVVCPNCTHHFKDRLCPMRPHAMRKIRARNLVEIEFGTLEDLEQWLYLNQLETNNDGMPTVMNAKKLTKSSESSLKTVGSLLPGLVEERKEDQKRISIILKENENCKDSRKKKNNSRANENRNSRVGEVKKENKEVMEPIRIPKKSRSPLKKENKMDSRKEEESDKRRKGEKPLPKNPTEPRKETTKRKHSSSGNDAPISKTPKKSISERIHFPSIKKEEFSGSSKQPIEEKVQWKENLLPSSSINHVSLKTEKIEKTRKREPIVWDDSPKDRKAEIKSIVPRNNSSTYELKVKTIEKRKDSSCKESTPKPINIPSTSENKPKYKFMRTSEKHSSENSIPTDSKPVVNEENRLFNESNEHQSYSEPSHQNDSLTRHQDLWNVIPVKKSTAVLDHVFKRCIERQSFQRNWQMIVLNGDIPQIDSFEIQISENHPVDEKESENKSQNMIADSLKRIGVSEEGIAVLKRKLGNCTEKMPQIENKESSIKKETNDSNSEPSNIVHSQPVAENKAYNEIEQFPISDSPQNNAEMVPGTSNFVFNINNIDEFEDDENDAFHEFFPELRQRASGVTPTYNESSHRAKSTESYGYMVDQEEDELALLVREESVIPPNGDCLLTMDDPFREESVLSEEGNEKNENYETTSKIGSSDWKQFCLEDLEDDTDETTRERRLSEMERNEKNDANMEWDDDRTLSNENSGENDPQMRTENYSDEFNLEDVVGMGEEDEEEEEYEVEKEEEKEEEVEQEREQRQQIAGSVPLEMNSDFRLSDDEDIISPITSTPRKQEFQNNSGELRIQKESYQRADSSIEELDWNFDEDEREEEEGNSNDTIIENPDVGGIDDTDNRVESNKLEDGEISEDDENEMKETKETKKPIRERIKFDDNQVDTFHDRDRRRDRYSRSDNSRRDYSPNRRRRSSEENRVNSYKRDNDRNNSRSLLKRKN